MESNPELRQYNPIWKQLKQSGKVSVTAPRPLHARIIKAVKKEKWLDIGFKIQLDGKIAVLSHARSNSILTFFLEIKPHTLDMRVTKKITPEQF